MPKTKEDDNKKGRGKKLRPIAVSDRTAELMARFDAKKSKKDRLKEKSTTLRKSKRRAKDAFNLVRGSLPDEEVELMENLLENAEDEETIDSLFSKAFSTLHEDASNPNADFRSDDAAKNMNRAALALILSLIPEAEIAYRKDSKQTNAYALNSFIDQARELAADLRMISDADGQSEFISRRIVLPLFLNAAQILITEMTNLKSSVDTEVRDNHTSKTLKKSIDQTAISIGRYLAEMQGAITSQVSSYLQGDSSAFNVPAVLPNGKVSRKKHKKRRSGDIP